MQIAAVHLAKGIDEETFAHWLACLPGERRMEILARNVRADRERSLAGEMLARAMLARALRCPPCAVPILRGAHGKPVLKDHPNLFFNVSHSGDYAVCVVSGRSVGVDIEQVRAYRPRVAQRVCSETERALLAQSENPARLFCRLWTLKESYVKLTGTGIGVPLQEISFAFAADGLVIANQGGVRFHSLELWDGYFLSVCERKDSEIIHPFHAGGGSVSPGISDIKKKRL